MKGNEQVRRLTFCLMVVHRYSCKKCKNVFVQAVSTSDTDMAVSYTHLRDLRQCRFDSAAMKTVEALDGKL